MLIRFEHSEWLVVEKPTGVLVHPTRPDGTYTLWHELKEKYPNEHLSLIQRLDRETSGLILVSRTSHAASQLGKMMMRRQIQKAYETLVLGQPPDEGVVDAPIDRLGKYQNMLIYLKRGIVPQGQPSVTQYRRLETRKHPSGTLISKLHVRPMTGRLHQIRVHLSSLGHPVVGDKIYGPDESCYLEFMKSGWTPKLESILWLPRHALHANQLTFEWDGQPFEITCPLAEDLEIFWNQLLDIR